MRAQHEGGYLVDLIIAIAGGIVILVLLWPAIQEAIWGSAEVGTCAMSTLLSAGIAEATLGMADIPTQCKTKRIHVTDEYMKELVQRYNPSKYIRNYLTYPDDTPEWMLGMIYSIDNPERAERRWAFNKLIADEINECRQKYLVDLRLGEAESPLRAIGMVFVGVRTICYPCARIVIDESVKNRLGHEFYGFQFDDWLKANKPKRSEKTYYDLIYGSIAGFPEVGEPGPFENLTRRSYVDNLDGELVWSVADSPAIAITHKYTSWPLEYLPFFSGYEEEDWRYFRIMPYGRLTQECSVILGV